MIPILEALLKILPIQEQKYLWEIVSRLVKITSKRKNINFTCVSHTGQLHPWQITRKKVWFCHFKNKNVGFKILIIFFFLSTQTRQFSREKKTQISTWSLLNLESQLSVEKKIGSSMKVRITFLALLISKATTHCFTSANFVPKEQNSILVKNLKDSNLILTLVIWKYEMYSCLMKTITIISVELKINGQLMNLCDLRCRVSEF